MCVSVFCGISIEYHFSNTIGLEKSIHLEGVKFWVAKNIIYCTFCQNFAFDTIESKNSEFISRIIYTLSKGKYLPLIIILKGVGIVETFKLFNYFSPFSLLYISAHSHAFVVESVALKIVLILFCLANGNAFWNNIFTKLESANYHSNQKLNNLNLLIKKF